MALIAAALIASGCSSSPPRRTSTLPPVTSTQGDQLARASMALLGAPYRYGGRTPRGFDCSGLVHYLHERQGLAVPRTAAAQHRAAQPVPLDALIPGDLVFFAMGTRSIDHVGVYVGDGEFVHAPRSARPVSLQRLDDPYYRRRIVAAGRFWASAR
jgi:murein DD-endopeptidase